jgi:uncharacterized membrane protein (UPF0127 family)
MRDGDILTFRTQGGVTLKLELALSEEKRALGLMHRKELESRKGMFFLYTDEPQRRSMWMKNMNIPLDIVWLDGSLRVLSMKKGAEPCCERDDSRCPRYSSIYKCQHAIELAAGEIDKLGITIGERLTFVKRQSSAA